MAAAAAALLMASSASSSPPPAPRATCGPPPLLPPPPAAAAYGETLDLSKHGGRYETPEGEAEMKYGGEREEGDGVRVANDRKEIFASTKTENRQIGSFGLNLAKGSAKIQISAKPNILLYTTFVRESRTGAENEYSAKTIFR